MRIPAPAWSFPTKDELADYLESYAARFDRERASASTALQGRRSFRRLRGRPSLRGGQCDRRHRSASDSEGSGLRARSSIRGSCSRTPPNTGIPPSCKRESSSSAAATRGRDRRRAVPNASLLAGGPEGRRDPGATRHPAGSPRLSRLPVPRASRREVEVTRLGRKLGRSLPQGRPRSGREQKTSRRPASSVCPGRRRA